METVSTGNVNGGWCRRRDGRIGEVEIFVVESTVILDIAMPWWNAMFVHTGSANV